MVVLVFTVLVSYLCTISGQGSRNQMRGNRDLRSSDPVVKEDKFKVATASFGTLVADNTFSRVEGEITVVTHLTMAPGFDGYHYDKDGEHHGRKLDHMFEQKWENQNCDTTKRVVLVGDCHSNNGGQDYSALLIDVVDRWNNIPQNQDLTGATFIPSGITLQKATCDGDTKKTCDNDEVRNRISSCNGNYGDTGWAVTANTYYNPRTNFIVKVISKVNEYYDPSNGEAQHVLCRGMGYGLGVTNRDESSADLDTCMGSSSYYDDRGSSSSSVNRYPNQHDVEVLDEVYGSCSVNMGTDMSTVISHLNYQNNEDLSWFYQPSSGIV
mmetsp:Transcript_22423/g.21657  ORF Transcript_22423/g.21657 Transcript_22423/m.21657 type:complete len:325 (+) Transcript_22423:226-1200(+)